MNQTVKQNTAADRGRFLPGLTPRSLFASLFCMLLAGIYTQYSMVIIAEGNQSPEQVLPVPAMAVLLLLVGVIGALYALFKVRMLTRAELLCVTFTLFFSVPLMTQGMWHRFVGLIAAPLRTSSFDYIDAYNENLWPHGPNVLQGRLVEGRVETSGNAPIWAELEYEEGRRARLPRLKNTTPDEVSSVSIVVPAAEQGDIRGVANPHLVSILARATGMEAESLIFCRVYADGADSGNELFSERKAEKKTYLHKRGFVRVGAYGMPLADQCRSTLRVEFGLRGRGEVILADPKGMSVAAIEGAFRGRPIMVQSEYERLPPADRPPGMIVKPDRLWSLAGLKFLVGGYIPLREWLRPALVWSAFVLLLAAACFAVNVIMRKKWAESERYPLPNVRIPLALIGAEEPGESALGRVWSNPYMWAGFGVAVFWGGLKGWHAFNPAVPDLSIDIALGPYVQNPVWGGMFNTSFSVSLFIVSIAVFFELNVLISMVLGYWICRSVFWIGQVTNLKVNIGFPWRDQQAVGAYLGYFFIVLALSRKYLVSVFKAAVRGDAREEGDTLSSRAAVGLLLGCCLGALIWGRMVGASLLSMGVYFGFLVMLGFVTSKFRAECGLPFGYFTPYNAMLIVSLCGGLPVFGAEGMLVALLLSGFLSVTVFFLVPGAQFELIQLGKRMRIQPRHIIYTALIGILGGLFIGGWVFLSNAYAFGGDNIRFQWAFNGLNWFMQTFRSELGTTTAAWLRESSPAAVGGTDWGARMMVAWGAIAMILTVLRQLFSGFWFHPIGFILGSSNMMEGAVWGSLLVAWAVRGLVLKVGGATSVKNKLQPFFVGVFVGSLVVLMLFSVVNSLSVTHGATQLYQEIP
jgi:hypothetical protein